MTFWAGGCASCHATADNKQGNEISLGGGLALKTAFGTFRVPNISPDTSTGIGNWSQKDFSNAMLKGIAPDGRHYFPAFPYTSYARMNKADITNLWAYLQTLPPVANRVNAHSISPLLKNRMAISLWKNLYFKKGPAVRLVNPTPQVARGQYLVEGPGHCAECHTPRNRFGGFDYTRWLAGGAAMEGGGYVPNITPHEDGLAGRSIDEITQSFSPNSNEITSSRMDDVRRSLAKLPINDRRAIAAYLKAVPALPTASPALD